MHVIFPMRFNVKIPNDFADDTGNSLNAELVLMAKQIMHLAV